MRVSMEVGVRVAPAGRCFTVLALAGVNVEPTARGRGLGALVTQAAFAELERLQAEQIDGGPPAPSCCLFQTGFAMPFYLKLGARTVRKEAIVEGSTGALAFTDKHVMIWPAAALWPPPPAAGAGAAVGVSAATEQASGGGGSLGYPLSIIDACGFTGSWAWWRQPAPGMEPASVACARL
jgi:hypothetical protein